jgi:hypothetical protein
MGSNSHQCTQRWLIFNDLLICQTKELDTHTLDAFKWQGSSLHSHQVNIVTNEWGEPTAAYGLIESVQVVDVRDFKGITIILEESIEYTLTQ